MTLAALGFRVSGEYAIGPAQVINVPSLNVAYREIPLGSVDAEVARYQHALETAKQQLRDIGDQIPTGTPPDVEAFISTHLLMLEDDALSESPLNIIRRQCCNAEWALRQQQFVLEKVFDEIEDSYLRTRKDDIEHLVRRILRALNQDQKQPATLDESYISGAGPGSIIVAKDLSPAEVVLLHTRQCAGFVTERGGPTSHTTILARSMNIPAIVGLRLASHWVNNDETVIIDGDKAMLLVTPDPNIHRYYQDKLAKRRAHLLHLQQQVEHETRTQDGQTIIVRANVDSLEDVAAAKKLHAEGVGLFRTEYLFMNRRDIPSEEEQYDYYRQAVEMMTGHSVVIRTVDIGADKSTQTLPEIALHCKNPALGLRALRLCVREPETLLVPQIRALLRASAHGDVRILLPMLSCPRELNQILAIIQWVQTRLHMENIPFDASIKIGGMIEVPAAAIAADIFAKPLDFFSIGTNDLIQYATATDRVNDEVNHLYDPLHPAILRMLSHVVRSAKQAHIPVSSCGEMASDPKTIRLLLALGLRELSVPPPALLSVKDIIMNTDLGQLMTYQEALANETDLEIICAHLRDIVG